MILEFHRAEAAVRVGHDEDASDRAPHAFDLQRQFCHLRFLQSIRDCGARYSAAAKVPADFAATRRALDSDYGCIHRRIAA
jgi:hypothetical protein